LFILSLEQPWGHCWYCNRFVGRLFWINRCIVVLVLSKEESDTLSVAGQWLVVWRFDVFIELVV
jgi:hypothetical protein